MPRHPADGPRLKTLYVPQSTRKRRRRSASIRRRRLLVLAVVLVLGVGAAGIAYRDTIGRRIYRLVLRPKQPGMVRDVTLPKPAKTAPVKGA